MFTFQKLFSRAQQRFRRLLRKRPVSGILEDPMVVVPMLLPALISAPKSPMAVMKVAVTSLNADLLICKSQKLLEEGARMNLEIALPDGQPLHVLCAVDWVDISPVAHSVGLRIVHRGDSRKRMQAFCQQLRAQLTA